MIAIGPGDLMLAEKAKPFSDPGWIFELKYDGYRVLVCKDGSSVRMTSRNGHDAAVWFPRVAKQLGALPGRFTIDTEVCVVDASGVPDFEAMRAAMRGKHQHQIALFAFDLLTSGARDLRDLPVIERKDRLRKLLKVRGDRLMFVDHVEQHGEALFTHAIWIGMEGVMAKRADSPYVAGRSPLWLKLKPAGHHDGWKRPRRRASV